MKIYKVKRKYDEVYVILVKTKLTNKFHFINLTKEHICPCQFDTIKEAEDDLRKYENDGRIICWETMTEIKLNEKGIVLD